MEKLRQSEQKWFLVCQPAVQLGLPGDHLQGALQQGFWTIVLPSTEVTGECHSYS